MFFHAIRKNKILAKIFDVDIPTRDKIQQHYCKFGNFRENFIFTNSVKRHIYPVENSRLGHDLPTSANDRLISTFRKDFIFTKLHENKTLVKISEFTVVL